MNVHWILEETNYQNDNNVAQRLMYLLQELGNNVTVYQYVPFEGTDYSFLANIGTTPTVFFGTWNGLDDIQKRVPNPPKPLAWYDPYLFQCTTYYKHLNNFLLQNERSEITLEELPAKIEKLYLSLGVKNHLFLRPNDNEKSFPGQILRQEHFDSWYRHTTEYRQVPLNNTVIIAKPKDIAAEWRFVLVNGKVVGGSQYKLDGMIYISECIDQKAASLAEEVANTWQPFPVFVVDVALVQNEYKLIEIGPFNYAGLYKANLKNIVQSINEFVLGQC